MKVLVTGAAGFLGSHVADVLRHEGYDVATLDIQPCPGRHHIVADLLDSAVLTEVVHGFDAICHLAAVGDVYLAFEKPNLAAAVNVTGTANLLEACLHNGIGKVVYASTWEVYGQPQYNPIDEDHPCNPDHPYSITKLAGEQLALSYDRLKGLPVLALRLGTAYGTRMRSNSVFSIFIRRARAGEPLTIQGTGEQTRQFIHARDIGRAFARALDSPLHAQALNIVAQESISIRQLAELVVERFPTDIIYEPARAGDVPPAVVSSVRAQRLLGWDPRISFRQGLWELMDSPL